jgi:SAM-dependent methyltransferase
MTSNTRATCSVSDVAPDWFADDSLWLDTFDAQFPPQRFAAAFAEIEELLQLTRYRGGAVLDLGCGPGIYLIALVRRGISATGVDVCARLLERARTLVPEQVELVQSDIRYFERPSQYALAISMYTSFGYFPTRSENLQVLKTTFANLVPGGCIVIDIASRELLRALGRQIFPGSTGAIVRTITVDDAARRLHVRYDLDRPERGKHHEFQIPLADAADLEAMLRTAGFGDVRFYSSFDGAPFDESKPQRCIAIAYKE